MDKNIYLINLYDIYSSLLTEKQQNYFEEYYFDNLSLKEQASYFEQALIDYIATLNSAFDNYYGYETPTEKGYSDE